MFVLLSASHKAHLTIHCKLKIERTSLTVQWLIRIFELVASFCYFQPSTLSNDILKIITPKLFISSILSLFGDLVAFLKIIATVYLNKKV